MSTKPRTKVYPSAETERPIQSDSRADSEMQGDRVTDELAFSPDAAEVREFVARVNRLPEVRPDKVSALKSLLQEGNYWVSPEQVAEGMISSVEARKGLGVGACTRRNIADAERLARQSRPEFGSKTHDVSAGPAPRDDESREDSDTSHIQMDDVA